MSEAVNASNMNTTNQTASGDALGIETTKNISINDPGKDGGIPTSEKPNTEQATPQKKHKIVVDKKEIELEEEALIRWAQKGAAADKRMYEQSKERKQLEHMANQLRQEQERLNDFWGQLENDPFGTLQQFVKDQEKLRSQVEPWVLKKYQMEQMSEEQRSVIRAREEAEQYKRELELYKKQQQEAELNAQSEHFRQHFESIIIKGLEKFNVDRNAKTVTKFANYLENAINNGVEINDTVIENIANNIKEDNNVIVTEVVHEYIARAKALEEKGDEKGFVQTVDALQEFLGSDVSRLLAKGHLARLKAGQPKVPSNKVLDTPKVDQKPQKRGYMSEDEERAERMRRVAEIDKELKANKRTA